MKKKILRPAAIILALLLLVVALSSCASSGKKMMTLGKQSISVNMYEFFLSRQKGTLCNASYYGAAAKGDDFWRTTISADGMTYNDFWTAYIFDSTKIYLAALYLFEEEYGLTLPASAISEVDEALAELLDYDADGSRSAFNSILSQYGVNYKILREIYLLEAKINYLQEYLYGADLSKVSDTVKEEYYQDNYVRFKQVFFANYSYVYEVDEDGTAIYYDTETEQPIYDSTTGIRKFDENGKALTDKNGRVIYYNEDGTIAYDKVNGEPAYTFDSDGKYKTVARSAAEMAQAYKDAEEIIEFTLPGDTSGFETLIKEFSDDNGEEDYPNGYYFSTTSSYAYDYINDVIAALGDMAVGEIRIVESDYGYHVIMKYKLERGAYDDEDNAEWFDGFGEDVAEWLFYNKCEAYIDEIVIDDDLAAGVDIMSTEPNYYY